MTDKSVPPNGDDGGSAETPTERLLREAMNARTSLITAHDLRPASPPSTRIRRLRPVYMVTVPLLGLAAAAAIGVVTLKGSPVADHQTPPPAATVSVSPTPTPVVTPTPSTPTQTATETPAGSPETDAPETTDPTPTGTPYTFRGVKLTIPAGWRAAPTDPASFHLCLLSPGAPQSATGQPCEPYGVDVAVYDTDVAGWPSTGDLDAPGGWAHQPYCPVWGNPHVPVDGELKDSSGPVKSTPTVSGRAARKSQWQASCGASSFKVQVWGLPKDLVFVSASGLKADYQDDLQSIVDSLDVSGHHASLSTDIGVTFDGLKAGQQLPANGTPVTLSVTYKNTSQTAYPSVQPLFFTESYPGTPDAPVLMNAGKLERLDGDTWHELPLSPGGGMDYAIVSKSAAFPLAPGQSRTVKFRLTLDAKNGPGAMPVRAQALLPYDGKGQLTPIGESSFKVSVVK